MKEVWKDIQDYEGYYKISDKGRVKSLDRYVKNSVVNSKRLVKGIILKQHPHQKGKYQLYQVSLMKNNIKKRCKSS